MSKPPFGSFSPRRAGSFGGSRPVSQSHTVFRMAWRTLQWKGNSKNWVSFPINRWRGSLCMSTDNYTHCNCCIQLPLWNMNVIKHTENIVAVTNLLEGLNNSAGFDSLYTTDISKGADLQELTLAFVWSCVSVHLTRFWSPLAPEGNIWHFSC